LAILAAEEGAAEIVIEGWGFPDAVAASSSSVCSKMWAVVAAERVHVRSEDVDTVNRLNVIG